MDPSAEPPAATEPSGVAEPPAHVADAAKARPPNASNNHSHPPYAEMIAAAITALKEKNGSSRQAIAKYIEKAYAHLPSTHSALLTHHLKRLKNGGHLEMVKHSYKLPRSIPLSSTTTATGNSNPFYPGPKSGPGRSPKAMVEAQPNNTGVRTNLVLLSLGLVDGPAPVAKRGPGRPPKPKTGLVGTELGRPVGFKRGRGRPPRPKLLSVLMDQSGPKRRPGRPPGTGPIGSPGLPRPRGRPKKGGSVMKAAGRARGRPLKNAVAAVTDGGALVAVGDGVLLGKRRGRPPRGDGVKKPRKLSAKPLGRPRKSASLTGIQAAATQQVVAYQDLKNKFEHFQSRLKQAVGMVKPHLNKETAVSALAALQELEELATMELSDNRAVAAAKVILRI